MTREEAAEEIRERINIAEYVDSSYVDCLTIEALKIALKELEEPERTGHWNHTLDTETRMYECSVCGARMFEKEYDVAVGKAGFAFCPYCGADMSGEESVSFGDIPGFEWTLDQLEELHV